MANPNCGQINLSHGMWSHPAYKVFHNAKARCENVNHPKWKDYGARGIKFEFESFESFWSEFGESYSEGLTMGRKENDGPYSVENFQWETQHQQSRNKRSNIWVTFQGETLVLADWAKRFGKSQATLSYHLKNGNIQQWFSRYVMEQTNEP